MRALELQPGSLLSDRYRIERLLGRGAFGAVFLAEQQGIGRKVAIKLLDMLPGDDVEVAQRFLREGRVAVTIGHPGVPSVFDLGTTPRGVPYLVMEYLEGETLADFIIRNGSVPPAVASAIVVPILEVLEAAHSAGIVHRDLKPANVMLVNTRRKQHDVKLLDFGVSKLFGEAMTRTGVPMGTPAYMAPEQAMGAKEATAASDLYSVGVVLFELLSGRLPFSALNALEMMAIVVRQAPPQLASLKPGLDGNLCALVDNLLRKAPNERPPSAAVARRRLISAARPDPAALWSLGRDGTEPGTRAAADRADRDTNPVLDTTRPRLVLPTPQSVVRPGDDVPKTEPAMVAAPPIPVPLWRKPELQYLLAGIVGTAVLVAGGWVGAKLVVAATAVDDEVAKALEGTTPIPAPARPEPPRPVAPNTTTKATVTAGEREHNARQIAAAESHLANGETGLAVEALQTCRVDEVPCPEGDWLRERLSQEIQNKADLDDAEAAIATGDVGLAKRLLSRSARTAFFGVRHEALSERLAAMPAEQRTGLVGQTRPLLPSKPFASEATATITARAQLVKGNVDGAKATMGTCVAQGGCRNSAALLSEIERELHNQNLLAEVEQQLKKGQLNRAEELLDFVPTSTVLAPRRASLADKLRRWREQTKDFTK